MRYADMPSTTGTGRPQPNMMCEDCGDGPYSAERGDYFTRADADEVVCGSCGGPMVLVREVHYFEPVEPDGPVVRNTTQPVED